VAEVFSRTPNGCGHRQIAMALRAECGARIADKTVLKMMHEMGISCGIRQERDYRRYNSYRGVVGRTFENVVGRDFSAELPWQKMGTDVTEFSQPWGKAYLAPVYDFASKEIVAWSVSESPNMAQQLDLLGQLAEKMPAGAAPVLHSDMGWQYQNDVWCSRLREMGIRQSMSRKGNCLDNAATEQVFGHLKDEFSRGRVWDSFESFKADLDAYIVHWNTERRQVKLKGLTPEEFRNQALVA
jgi:putative transposase